MQPAIGFARRELQFVEVFIIQETYEFIPRGLIRLYRRGESGMPLIYKLPSAFEK
jgi:hypothetical protein